MTKNQNLLFFLTMIIILVYTIYMMVIRDSIVEYSIRALLSVWGIIISIRIGIKRKKIGWELCLI